MRLIYQVLFLLVSTFTVAQQPVLLDTLGIKQKTILKNKYNIRKTDFFAQLDRSQSKEEAKEMKSIFEESFKDIHTKIDKNEILYDSPLNVYLDELTAAIQKGNPEIPKNLSILVSRENKANAFNRGEGTIIINNYLFNTLENEDQLVYVLCHEMAHQSLNHVVKSVEKYVSTNNSTELKAKTKQLKKQRYRKKTNAENLLKELAYQNSAESRTREIQADSLGYVFYSRLNRDPQQVAKVLMRLRDSDKERDSLTLEDYTKIFESFRLTAQEKWFKMDSFEDYYYQKNTKFNTDSLRTHPNCDVRIEKLTQIAPEIEVQSTTVKNGGSDTFKKWKQSVVYQSIQNEFLLNNYGNSLYEALKLYNRKPDDEQLRQWIALNFKKLYEAKKAYQLNRYVSQVSIVEYTDSYNLFSTFIFNLDLADLETICESI